MDDETFVHSIRAKDIDGVQLLDMDKEQVCYPSYPSRHFVTSLATSLATSLVTSLSTSLQRLLSEWEYVAMALFYSSELYFPLLAQMAELGLSILRQRKVLMKGLVLLKVEKGVWRPKDELSFPSGNRTPPIGFVAVSPKKDSSRMVSPLPGTPPLNLPAKKSPKQRISRKYSRLTSPRGDHGR